MSIKAHLCYLRKKVSHDALERALNLNCRLNSYLELLFLYVLFRHLVDYLLEVGFVVDNPTYNLK